MQNLNIQIPEDVYQAIAEAAAGRGQSIEDIISEQLAADFGAPEGQVGAGFFTDEILAEIDAAREEASCGGSLTVEQVTELRITKSKSWRQSHSA